MFPSNIRLLVAGTPPTALVGPRVGAVRSSFHTEEVLEGAIERVQLFAVSVRRGEVFYRRLGLFSLAIRHRNRREVTLGAATGKVMDNKSNKTTLTKKQQQQKTCTYM